MFSESSTKCLFKDIKHIGPKYFQGVRNISRALTDYSLIFNSWKFLVSKSVCGIFHFRFPFVFIRVSIFIQVEIMDSLALNLERH